MFCRSMFLMHPAAAAPSGTAAAAGTSALFMILDQAADQHSYKDDQYGSYKNVSHYETDTSLVSLVAS